MNAIPLRKWAGKASRTASCLRSLKATSICSLRPIRGLAYQQNLRGRRIAILQLSTNKLRAIEAAAAQLRDAVETLPGAEFRRLEIPV
jgi:hypothetical protein